MTISSRATQRSHFSRFQAELAFGNRWRPLGEQPGGQINPDALKARRLHLRETLLGASRTPVLAAVR